MNLVRTLVSGFVLFTLLSANNTGARSSFAASGDAGSDPVPAALVLARQSLQTTFERAENVVCDESVIQQILGKDGHVQYREESKYSYQMRATLASGKLQLLESRDEIKTPFRDLNKTLLVTTGFSAMLLILHPEYEPSYQFKAAGEDQTPDGLLTKIDFTPIAGASSPAALRLRGKNYPLPLSGTVWLDKRTGAVVRLTASVDSSLSDLGLSGMSSDIHYALIQFHNPEEGYWMPISATIDLESPKKHWRNIHRFTAFRRFTGTIRVEPRATP